MNIAKYDLIIIGGGPAGLVASKLARGFGKTVAIIEEKYLGGECTWNGCVPSKTLIHIANLVSISRELNNFSADEYEPSNIKLDLSKIISHIQNKRNFIYQTHTPEMLKKEGIDVFFGSPSFIDNFTIELENNKFSAKKFIVATGSSPFIPEIEGLETINYLTNETIFELKELPKSMVILGAGPIGIEMASALNKLGVTITIIERNENILSREDPELSNMLADRMRKNGIKIYTSFNLAKIVKNKEIKFICYKNDESQIELSAESLFIAVGRKPNIENLNLEKIGIKTTSRGIIVNNKLQTSVSNIYACGDVVGPYQFSHMAEYQATIATQNAFIPLIKKYVNYKNVVWVTFSDPEFASAGLTESDARERFGDKIKIFRENYNDIDRAKIDDNTFGLAKIICDSKGYILGAHILGTNAGELIHEVQVGKYYNLRIWNLYNPIHAYPTYSELLWHLAKKAYIESLYKNPLIRFVSWLLGGKNKK